MNLKVPKKTNSFLVWSFNSDGIASFMVALPNFGVSLRTD